MKILKDSSAWNLSKTFCLLVWQEKFLTKMWYIKRLPAEYEYKKNITSDTQTNGCSTVIFEFPDKTSPVSRRTDIKVQSLSLLTVDSVAWVKLTAVRLLSGSGQCGQVNGSISRGGEEVWTPGDCTNGHTEHSNTVVTLWHSLDTYSPPAGLVGERVL